MGGKKSPLLVYAVPILLVILVGGLAGGAILMLSLPPQEDVVAEAFTDDTFAEDSDAEGEVEVNTELLDKDLRIIRRTDDDIYDMPYAIVDPVSKQEVVWYNVRCSFQASGKNIDWTSFTFNHRLTYTRYWGIDDLGNSLYETKDLVLEDNKEGPMEIPTTDIGGGKKQTNIYETAFHYSGDSGLVPPSSGGIAIEALMPDTIFPDGGGGENFAQRTAEGHGMVFVLDAEYYISVDDIWGNTYDSSYKLHIELKLYWEGSSLEMVWNPTTVTATSTTATTVVTTTSLTKTTIVQDTTDDLLVDSGTDLEADVACDEALVLTDKSLDVVALSLTGMRGSILIAVGVIIVGAVGINIVWWKRFRKQ